MNTENKRSTLSLKSKPAEKSTKPSSKPAARKSIRPKKAGTQGHSGFGGAKQTANSRKPTANRKPSGPRTSTARPRSGKPSAHVRAQTENTLEPTAEARLDIDKLHVYHLPASSLAYQISWAAHLLVAIGQGFSLQQLLAQVRMDESVRPNVQRLTFDALRHWGTTRFWLKKYIEKTPAEWIQAVLCVALTQLLLQEENEFTLVNETVRAIDNNKPHAKGMVNAILRRFLRERDTWIAQSEQNEEAHYNHPQWWIDQLKAQYPEQWRDILAVNNTRPPMTLRVNAQKSSTNDYQALLTQNEQGTQRSDLSAQALILNVPCAVDQLPHFFDGAVSVQDAGAQLSVQLLDVQENQRVLDACAAPGGKTAHLLELHNNIHLTALEKDPVRTERIHENLKRLQLSAQVLTCDANRTHEWWDGQAFDRILLDAPCSASGIVRRHPDIRWLRQAEDSAGLARQQTVLLRTMWQVLAEGGRLVYCTCSIFATEGEDIIQAFMQHTPNAQRIYPSILQDLQQTNVVGQLLPSTQPQRNHDGFFYAILEKATPKTTRNLEQ